MKAWLLALSTLAETNKKTNKKTHFDLLLFIIWELLSFSDLVLSSHKMILVDGCNIDIDAENDSPNSAINSVILWWAVTHINSHIWSKWYWVITIYNNWLHGSREYISLQ